MAIRLSVLIAAVAASAPVLAALPPAPIEAPRPAPQAEDPGRLFERAFARLSEDGGLDEFMAELRPLTSDAKKVTVTGLRSLIARMVAQNGPPLRTELIRVETAGLSFARYHYLQIYKNAPSVWSATITRHEGRWVLRALDIKSQISDRRDLFDPGRPAAGDFDEPIGIAMRFTWLLGTDDRAALHELFGLRSAGGEDAARQRLVDSLVSVRRATGWQHRNVEIARTEPITPSLIRFVLVEYAPTDYLVWELVFYKATERWKLIHMNFSSQPAGGLDILFPGSPLNPPVTPPPSQR